MSCSASYKSSFSFKYCMVATLPSQMVFPPRSSWGLLLRGVLWDPWANRCWSKTPASCARLRLSSWSTAKWIHLKNNLSSDLFHWSFISEFILLFKDVYAITYKVSRHFGLAGQHLANVLLMCLFFHYFIYSHFSFVYFFKSLVSCVCLFLIFLCFFIIRR